MNYVNNWLRPLTLSEQAITTTLDLADGQYRLTIADASRSRIEIVDATVTAGTADLVRGCEGTAIQDWPEGSVIYCALTAEQLAGALSALVLGSGAPATPPARPGQLYIDTQWPLVMVSAGAGHMENWVPIVGAPSYGYQAAAHSPAYSLPSGNWAVTVEPAVSGGTGGIACTLSAPAWECTPAALHIDIAGSAAQPITLNLNLAAVLSGASEVDLSVLDYSSGATVERVTSTIVVTSQAPVRLRVTSVFLDPADGYAGLQFSLERLPYDSITYINL